MELVTTTYNTLPIVVLVSAVAIYMKDAIIGLLSLDFVKQTLKTVFGLTPRETGELLIIQAKHIAIILKTSAELVSTALKSLFQVVVSAIPVKIVEIIGFVFNTTLDVMYYDTLIEFFKSTVIVSFYGIGHLIKLIVYLIPEILTFLETLGTVFYKIGQGFYAVLSAFNMVTDSIRSTWSWFQDPPVNTRMIMILAILICSVFLLASVKCLRWAKKKIE